MELDPPQAMIKDNIPREPVELEAPRVISEREAAKYPFLADAVSLVEAVNPQLEELTDPGYARALDRGAERVVEAITQGEVSASLADSMTELLSYPIANMYVIVLGERFLDRRYALGEAVRVYKLLRGESEARLAQIAREELAWDIHLERGEIDGQPHDFKLSFHNYLTAASGFREGKWKLVNRAMEDGYVRLSRMEAARLIQFEVEARIRENVSRHVKIALPDPIRERLDRVAKVFEENRARLGGESLPEEMVNEAFPPCMRYCLEGLLAGRRASHMERFGLTSFLVNVGMDLEQMVDLYTSVTDFDESLTRYQIEHIAGLRGTRTKYTPPTCATLRTHGICRNRDRLCDRVKHPLAYYRIKAKRLAQQQEEAREAEASNTTN